MYAYLRGTLAEVNMDSIVIDVHGIGYQVFLPANGLEYLPALGEACKVYTHLYMREDAMLLYGFLSKDDLLLFQQLISVSGVGPKAALAMLSAVPANELRFAILAQDSKAIAKAPGVGTKTAQRVILELKDKISLEESLEKELGAAQMPVAASQHQVKNEALQALQALGYSAAESLKATAKVEITDRMSVEDVLKQALKHMSLL